jgi:hypothetical protein
VNVKEKHTMDKMFINVVLVPFWCNPVFWFIRHELKMIHEFIADKRSVEDADTSVLSAMILQVAYPKAFSQLANSFFQQTIKRRLNMLAKIKNTRISYWSRIVALPLLVCISLAFTLKSNSKATGNTVFAIDTIPQNKNKAAIMDVVLEDIKVKDVVLEDIKIKDVTLEDIEIKDVILEDIPTSVGKNKILDKQDLTTNADNKPIIINDIVLDTIPKSKKGENNPDEPNMVFTKVQEPPQFPGGKVAWQKYLARNVDSKVPVVNGAPEGSYSVAVQFIVDTKGYLSDVKALTQHGYGMEDEALRIIKKGPRWEPAKQNGREVKAYHKQMITFIISSE